MIRAHALRVLPLVVLLALGACSRTPAEAQTDRGVATAAVEPVPAELPGVLARVNGEEVLKAEFEEAVRSIESRVGTAVPPEERDRFYRGLLDQLIGHKLLVQETRARGVSIPEAEIDAYIAGIRERFPSTEVFEQQLAQQQLTIDQLRAEARQDMAIARMVDEEIAPRVAVAPDQIEAFYRDNPEQFQQDARVRASHILIAVAADADAGARARARAQADDLLRQLHDGGDFAALARQHSQDSGSASQGGDLGFFEQGQMVPPFDAAAFSLEPGATSDVVETSFGFHIIRVAERQAARTVPLDEVRAELEEFLEARNRQQETDAFVTALKAKGTIEIFI